MIVEKSTFSSVNYSTTSDEENDAKNTRRDRMRENWVKKDVFSKAVKQRLRPEHMTRQQDGRLTKEMIE